MYAKYQHSPEEPASSFFPITPADSALPKISRGLFVGGAGTGILEVTGANDFSAPTLGTAATLSSWAVSGNTIKIPNHKLPLGQLVTVIGSVPTGLTSGNNYYVIVIDANDIQLASSLANAQAGTAIALSGTAGAFAVIETLVATAAAPGTITIPNHGFFTGDRVMVASIASASGGVLTGGSGTLPGGLTAQTAYFVIVVNANTISLATTQANAFASTGITFSSAGSGALSVFKSSPINPALVGYHPGCLKQVNAASTATNLLGMY
ncbi:MAG: hypothetical protein ACLP9L_04775 [Thermoguttaceae bacterium]